MTIAAAPAQAPPSFGDRNDVSELARADRGRLWQRVGTAVAVVLLVLGVVLGIELRSLNRKVSTLQGQITEMKSTEEALAKALAAENNELPDVSKIVDTVSPSVFTVQAGSALGSSWVVRSDGAGSDLVTNFHVVDSLWAQGGRDVAVANETTTMGGTITSVSLAHDLAMIHVTRQLPQLRITTTKAAIGDPVVVLGSPVGLSGTVTTGVVSAYRTEEGTEYLQFSAPVSPGSSGGPVVDSNSEVLGVTTQKIVDTGVEGLSFAIQSPDVCRTFSLEC